ncbi:MAG: hypothetical protein PVF75_00700 [Granulosicoccaceae bacterium]|jgi:hypothetical protein
MQSVTIARYDTMPEAHIALGRLTAEGIEAWLADENLVQTDWLYSIAVGGIKLQVEPGNVERALAILATDYSDTLSAEDIDQVP